MKLKKWHLFIIAALCFVLAFVTINLKYDRFYRVNGINNDNRALIELYLDQDEQNYLVENAIAVDQFINYIEIPDFNLRYYRYYNALARTNKYSSNEALISAGNTLADLLEVDFGSQSYDRLNTLVKNDLVDAYLNQRDFDFNNIDYYQITRTLYDNTDYTYVSDTNNYIGIMREFDNVDNRNLSTDLTTLSNNYTKESLSVLFNSTLLDNAHRLYDPSGLHEVINHMTFIGSYEPKDLVVANGMPRTHFTMYLTNDAYTNLLNMYKACTKDGNRGMILTQSYVSYDMASLNDDILAGYNEYQLGTSIKLQKMDISESDFANTDVYQWLINNCYQYGFVLRYPSDKVINTNHEFSANDFRYVGVEAATTMHEQNLSLEEFNGLNGE